MPGLAGSLASSPRGSSVLARLPLRSKLILVVSVPLFVILGFAGFGISNRLSDLDGQRQYSRLRVPNDALAGLQSTLENEGVLTTWFTATNGRTRWSRPSSTAPATPPTAPSPRCRAAGRRPRQRRVRVDQARVGRARRPARHAEVAAAPGRRPRRASPRRSVSATATSSTTRSTCRSAWRCDVSDRQLSDSMLGIVDLRSEQAASAPRRDDRHAVPRHRLVDAVQRLDRVADGAGRRGREVPRRPRRRTSASAFTRLRAEPSPDDTFRASAGSVPDAFPKVSITPAQYYENWRKKQAYLGGAIVGVQHVVDNMAAVARVRRAARGARVRSRRLDARAHRPRARLDHDPLGQPVAAQPHRGGARRGRRATAEPRRTRLQRGGDPGRTEIHPLTVSSNDEIGELASAFNTIQETTVRVAEEQASLLRKGIGDLYVNLARRNQSLVDRQLSLLDVLEAGARIPTSSRRCSSSTTSPPACAATPRACSCSRARGSRGSGASRSRSSTSSAPRAVRSPTSPRELRRLRGRRRHRRERGRRRDAHPRRAARERERRSRRPARRSWSRACSPSAASWCRSPTRASGWTTPASTAPNALLQAPPPPGLSLSRTLGLHVVAHLARPLRHPRAAPPRRQPAASPRSWPAGDGARSNRRTRAAPPRAAAANATPVDLADGRRCRPRPSADRPWSPSPARHPGAPLARGPPTCQRRCRLEPRRGTAARRVRRSWSSSRHRNRPSARPSRDVRRPFEPAGLRPAGVRRSRLFDPATFDPPAGPPGSSRSRPRPSSRWSSSPSCRSSTPTSSRCRSSRCVGAGEFPDPVVVVDPAARRPCLDPGRRRGRVARARGRAAGVRSQRTGTARRDAGRAVHRRPGPGRVRRRRRRPAARVPGASPLGTDGDAPRRCRKRSPGRHLSHQPAPQPAPGAERDDRPRPERVHDLLTRHLRGIRDGRGDDFTDARSCRPCRFGGNAVIRLSTEARNLNWLVSQLRRRRARRGPGRGRVVRRAAHRDVRRAGPHRRPTASRPSPPGCTASPRARRCRSTAAPCTRSSSSSSRRILFVMSISDASVLAVYGEAAVRRRPRRLRDGGAGGAVRERPDPDAGRGAPDRAAAVTWPTSRARTNPGEPPASCARTCSPRVGRRPPTPPIALEAQVRALILRPARWRARHAGGASHRRPVPDARCRWRRSRRASCCRSASRACSSVTWWPRTR